MDILKNKHVVTALLVTPVLAILGYFAVDLLVRETPHAAEAGGKYELLAKSNCRYSSGVCDLKNGDFELRLTSEWRDHDKMVLMLKSAYPLDGVLVAMVDNPQQQVAPVEMQSEGDDGQRWSLELPRPDLEQSQLRLVVASDKTLYYAETGMKFTLYETSFGKDLR